VQRLHAAAVDAVRPAPLAAQRLGHGLQLVVAQVQGAQLVREWPVTRKRKLKSISLMLEKLMKKQKINERRKAIALIF
jgi:hypothetical protein